ncbi:hypothetical protein ACVWXL_001122 [Bradyrhizobium sp. GM22.5]
MGEKDRVDGAERHAGLVELHHDAAACIDQDIFLAEPDQRCRRHAARVRARAAGAEQDDFHGATSWGRLFGRYSRFEAVGEASVRGTAVSPHNNRLCGAPEHDARDEKCGPIHT